MSKTITYKGTLPVGEQEKIHLSTNDGLTGYKIKKFQIMSQTPGTHNIELIGQIFLTDQTGSISSTVDFQNTDLIAAAFFNYPSGGDVIIMDAETFNQDIFVNITDASGNTVPGNFYIELEQFKLDINTSTFHTLKNIRSRRQ